MVEYENLRSMNEHFKKKKQEGRYFISRVKDNIQSQKEEKQRLSQVYREEFKRQSAKAVKSRARKEAYQKFGKTKDQRRAETLKAIDNFGVAMSGLGSTKKQGYISKKKRKDLRSSNDFDLGSFDL